MCNGADCLGVTETDNETPVEQLKDTPFGFHGRVRRLIEQATHLPVAARGAVTVVDARALVMAWTGAYPGRKTLGGGKRPRSRTHFRDDLLWRIDAKAGHGRESLHGILVHPEQRGKFLVELLHVRFQEV
jgi:hypothetical protein